MSVANHTGQPLSQTTIIRDSNIDVTSLNPPLHHCTIHLLPSPQPPQATPHRPPLVAPDPLLRSSLARLGQILTILAMATGLVSPPTRARIAVWGIVPQGGGVIAPLLSVTADGVGFLRRGGVDFRGGYDGAGAGGGAGHGAYCGKNHVSQKTRIEIFVQM